ncbi:MAG: alpha/beta fold hydrolase [Acidimicrobiia bacterium]|nr:alpha/beta fold hydrolase [Acidimicrobiia bacterium]
MIEPSHYLVPGFSQTAGAWGQVLEALSDRAAARPLDIPRRATFRQTAQALSEDRTGIWAGYSLGGRLALQVALDHPAAVDGLMLISTNPGITDPHARAARRADDEYLADQVEADGVDAFLTRWLSQPLFADLDFSAARRHRLNSAEAMAHQLRALGQGIQEPLWDRLPELAMPVTLVAGEHDEKFCAIARRAKTAIGANATVEVVAGAGHNLLLAAPGAVAGLLGSLR